MSYDPFDAILVDGSGNDVDKPDLRAALNKLVLQEAASQAEEDALTAAGYQLIVRTDLIGPPTPSLLLHADIGLADSSTYGRTATTVGSAAVSTVAARFGGGSVKGAAAGAITWADAAELKFGSGEFGMGMWFKLTAFSGTTHQQVLLSKGEVGGDVNNGWYLFFDSTDVNQGKMGFVARDNDAQIYFDSGIADTNWHHVEVNKSGATITLYLDGVAMGTVDDDLYEDTSVLCLGNWNYDRANYAFTGYLDELIVVKGDPLHTDDFTVPSDAY